MALICIPFSSNLLKISPHKLVLLSEKPLKYPVLDWTWVVLHVHLRLRLWNLRCSGFLIKPIFIIYWFSEWDNKMSGRILGVSAWCPWSYMLCYLLGSAMAGNPLGRWSRLKYIIKMSLNFGLLCGIPNCLGILFSTPMIFVLWRFGMILMELTWFVVKRIDLVERQWIQFLWMLRESLQYFEN